MKMLSQLTKQALSRHRMISSNPLSPAAPPSSLQTAIQQPTEFQMIKPLYMPSPAVQPPNPQPSPPLLQTPSAPPLPERKHTIYQQLMSSHDRMSERHLKKNT
ncbi:MAG: hypothetical protein IJE08_02455 [Clostridia bacterium]|nr:hypothetical protein [Clostridia bacterium]